MKNPRCSTCGGASYSRHLQQHNKWLCKHCVFELMEDIKKHHQHTVFHPNITDPFDAFLMGICLKSDLSFTEKLEKVLTSNEFEHEKAKYN